MKIAFFAIGIAVIATQIGCTWWLSHQSVVLRADQATQLDLTSKSVMRTECDVIWLREAVWSHVANWPAGKYTFEPGSLCSVVLQESRIGDPDAEAVMKTLPDR